MTVAWLTVLAVVIGHAGQAIPVPPAKKNAAKTARNSQKPKPAPATPATPPTGQPGVVVFVDPVTRQIREATPADIGTLSGTSQGTRKSTGAARSDTESANPANQLQGAGGAVGIALGPEFDTYVIVTKSPDGNLRTEEVTGSKAAQGRVLPGKTEKNANGK
jgi:hypothetical protein